MLIMDNQDGTGCCTAYMVVLLIALGSAVIPTTSALVDPSSNGTHAGEVAPPADTRPGVLVHINGSTMPDDNVTSEILPPRTPVVESEDNATTSTPQYTSPPTSPPTSPLTSPPTSQVNTATNKEQTRASPTTDQTLTASTRPPSTEPTSPTSLNASTTSPPPDETTSATTPDTQPMYANPDSALAATQLVIVSSCLGAFIALLLAIIAILVLYRNRKLPLACFQNSTADTQMASTDHPLQTMTPETENTKPKNNNEAVATPSLRYSNPYTVKVEPQYVNRETVYVNVETQKGPVDDNNYYETFDTQEANGDSGETDYMNMSSSR